MEFSKKWAGLVEYSEALKLQLATVQAIKNSEENNFKGVIIGLEHPDVVTLGVRGQKEKDLLQLPENVQVIKTHRGGEATFHNPGQLVIYPILNLRKINLGVKDYVNLLLNVTQSFLLSYGIKTKAGHEPGLYTDEGKIVAIGIKVSQGISSHGIAINVCNDTRLSECILVCGVKGQLISTMFPSKVDLEDVFECWIQYFFDTLNRY